MSQKLFANVDPPLWVAWHQALASIRVRFFRQCVTSVGIALGIAFFTSVELMSLSQSHQSATDDARLKWLVGTSLVMCLVGVTNSMLMSVAERYREIGTIKCLGASDGFIVKVFFLEAVILGLVGSLVGSFLGGGLVALARLVQHQSVTSSEFGFVVLLGTVTGMVLTVASAIFPAMQAARMPAASALRVEV